jgi:two-component system CheB/CheR fusion protein
MCEIVGYSCDELVGMSIHDLTSPEDRPLSAELNAAIRSGQRDRIDYEKRYLRRDGSPVWVHVTVTAIRDEGGSYLRSIGTVEDISLRKEAEEGLRAAKISAERAKLSAEEANSAKDQFLAVLSHELRTPLTPVFAAIQLMERDKALDIRLRPYVDVIRRNLELEARLIDDLLDLTRIVRGKIVLNRQCVAVRSLIERVVEICQPDIEARKLHFGVEMGKPDCSVNADPSRLQQVLWNLVKNAIKFTPDGGCVGIRCHCSAGQVIIEVKDSGVGIEPDSIERIFNAFEQGGQRVTRQFGGLGLGLAITKRLVEMHDGTISAQSAGKGQGATFAISLPAISGGLEQREECEEHVPMPGRTSRRILLVEDHGDTAATLQMLLQSSGFEVETAGGFQQAMNFATSNSIDLLISDLGLPDRSGLELIKELRQHGCSFKAIALSGYGREEDVRRSKEAGFAAHLTKPVDLDVLLRTVDSVISTAV